MLPRWPTETCVSSSYSSFDRDGLQGHCESLHHAGHLAASPVDVRAKRRSLAQSMQLVSVGTVEPMQRNDSRPHPLTLIRHGESTWNKSATVQGQSDDATLTKNGRLQVRDALDALSVQRFDAVISSDLQRALETAQIIADFFGLDVTTTPELRERSFGIYEGGPLVELDSSASGIREGRVVDAAACPEGGESLTDLYERCGELVEDLRIRTHRQRILLVTHGGTIRALRAYCAHSGMEGMAWEPVSNASIWTLDLGQAHG